MLTSEIKGKYQHTFFHPLYKYQLENCSEYIFYITYPEVKISFFLKIEKYNYISEI